MWRPWDREGGASGTDQNRHYAAAGAGARARRSSPYHAGCQHDDRREQVDGRGRARRSKSQRKEIPPAHKLFNAINGTSRRQFPGHRGPPRATLNSHTIAPTPRPLQITAVGPATGVGHNRAVKAPQKCGKEHRAGTSGQPLTVGEQGLAAVDFAVGSGFSFPSARRATFSNVCSIPRSHLPDLAVRAQHGDREARRALIDSFTPLVRARAREVFGREPLSFDDAVQEGYVGLLEGLSSWEADRGPLAAWLDLHVRRALADAAARNRTLGGVPIQMPRSAWRSLANLREAERRGGIPTTGVSEAQSRRLQAISTWRAVDWDRAEQTSGDPEPFDQVWALQRRRAVRDELQRMSDEHRLRLQRQLERAHEPELPERLRRRLMRALRTWR